MENADQFSLFLLFHICFSHFLSAVDGNNSFLNAHRLNCLIRSPQECTIMIHSQNGICLRPIIMPYSDNVSAGIVSDRISSAPLKWTLDRFGPAWKKTQVESHNRHGFVEVHV